MLNVFSWFRVMFNLYCICSASFGSFAFFFFYFLIFLYSFQCLLATGFPAVTRRFYQLTELLLLLLLLLLLNYPVAALSKESNKTKHRLLLQC